MRSNSVNSTPVASRITDQPAPMDRGHPGEGSWLVGSPARVADGVPSGDPALSAARPIQRASSLAWIGICFLVLAAPFEARDPVLRLPFHELSSVEAALIGGQVRAGGTFQYPTIAAMYLEVTFALALCLLPIALDSGRRGLAALVVAAVVLIAEAIIVTFTRAGLLAMVSTLCIVGALRYRQRGIDRAVQVLIVIALLIAVQVLTSRSLESLRLRWTTEGLEEWYLADVQAPQGLTMSTGSRRTVPVALTNTD